MTLILHNPRCSKSREALALLQSMDVKFETIDYLGGSLTLPLLEQIHQGLQIPAREMLRTKEEEFKKLKIDLDDDHAVLSAIVKTPIILERPIVLHGTHAVIARPPQKLLSLFNK